MPESSEPMADCPHPFGQMLLSVLNPEIGCVTMWAGLVSGIPTGWALCDGTNGTPDLRDKFVPCVGPLFAVGSEGGSVSHTHALSSDNHTHTINPGTDLESEPAYGLTTGEVIGSLTTPAASNIPPSYRLAYIMKI